MKKYHRVIEKIGPTGSARQALISNSFNSIFEYMIPDTMKYLLYLNGRFMGKATEKQYGKLMKLVKESALDRLKGDNFEESDRILYDSSSSVHVRNFILNNKDIITRVHTKIKQAIDRLLKVRQDTYDLQREAQEIYHKSSYELNSLDISTLIDGTKKQELGDNLNLLDLVGLEYDC